MIRSDVYASVVVPVFNRSRELRACVNALRNQVTTFSYEIIIVDDGSTEDLSPLRDSLVSFSNIKWVKLPRNSGPAVARNAGIKASSGEIIAFTDADCRPADGWLEAILSPFCDPNVSGVKGAYLTSQTDVWARLAQLEFEERYECISGADIDFIDTYSGAFRRIDLLAVGGFDPSFPKADNEDVDLSIRIKARGGRFEFVPNALVWHFHREGLWNYLYLKISRGYWRMKVYKNHPKKAGREVYTPWSLRIQLILIILSPFLILQEKFKKWWLAAWLGTCYPLFRLSFKREKGLLHWIPIFTLIRGIALVTGIFKGLLLLNLKPSVINLIRLA